MVRLKTAAIVTLSSFLISVSPAFAVDSSPSGKIPALKEKVENRIEKAKTVVANKVVNIKEKIASREAEVKARLAKFRDKKKAEIAGRLNKNLNDINQKRTEEMLKHLDKMSVILDKLQTRVGPTEEITTSRSMIASASSAVNEQAQKDYTVTVTTEAKIRADVEKVRVQLQQDLKAVRKQVIDAKQSVANAIRKAKSNGTK
jgi:hypothetical protein